MIWLLRADVTVAVGRVPGGFQEGRRVSVFGATAWRTTVARSRVSMGDGVATVARSRVSVRIPCEGEADSGFDRVRWRGRHGTAVTAITSSILSTRIFS